MKILRYGFFCWLLATLGCKQESQTRIDTGEPAGAAFSWQVRSDVPLPREPADNPMTEAKFQLGRHLFYDARLSGNGTQSCADCHHQDKAFTDGRALAVGSTGEVHPRNSQTLTNSAYNATLTWANPSLTELERQLLTPLFGEAPVEQGITDALQAEVLARISAEPRYAGLFAEAFPGQLEPVNFDNIGKALASFVRGLTSFNAAFDRFELGNSSALSESAKRGRQLFFSEELECFHCHGGYNFSDSTLDRTTTFIEKPFHNTGLFNIDGLGGFPEPNRGVFEITGNPADMGKFRAPTLRNIELTAPYMHDGGISTLNEVLDFYSAGGRLISSGMNAGDGRLSPLKDGFMRGFVLSEQEKSDLIEFLKSLTDTQFVSDPRLSNPWIPQS